MSNTSKSSNLLEVSWNPTIVNSKAKQQSTNINKHTQRIVTLKGRWLESLFAWHRGVCDFRIIKAFQQFIVVEQPGIKSSLCDDAAWTSADSHNTHVRPVPCNKCGPASLAQRFKGQSSMWRNQLPRYDPWLSWSWGKTRPGSPMSNTFHWRELLGIIMQVASASPDCSSIIIYIYLKNIHMTWYLITHYISSLLWKCGIWTLPSKSSHQIWQTLDIQCLYNATIYATQMSDCIGLQNLACAVSGLQNQNQSNYCCPWHAFEETWFTFSCWPWKI